MEDNRDDLNTEIAGQIKNKSRLGFFTRLAAAMGFVPNKNKEERTTMKIIDKPKEKELKGDQSDVLDKLQNYVDLTQPEAIRKLYEEWEQDTQNTYDNIGERMDRLDALLYMHDNYTKISAAVQETAQEIAMVTSDEVFQVTSADPKWDEKTNKLLKDNWEWTADKLKDIGFDLVLFGESFEGNEVNHGGIVKKTLLKPTVIQEKLVFDPVDVVNFNTQKQGEQHSSGFTVALNGGGTSYSSVNTQFTVHSGTVKYCSRSQLLSDYLDHLEDVATSQMFTSHLLGYRWMDDQMLAPWQVSHYAVGARNSEFKPYGRPPLLSCLPFFKAFQRASGLEDIRKRLSLPFNVYEVNTQGTNPLRAMTLVRKVKQQFLSTGIDYESTGMDGPSICTSYWTSKDLLTITRQGGSGEGDGGAGVEEKKFLDDMISLCTLVPPSYINPAAEGFQLSGKALIELSAPFRGLVNYYRNIILNQIKEDIILHYSIKGEDCPEFSIKMNVKSGIANDDYGSAIQTAQTVLGVVASIIGCAPEEVPEDILIDVYTKYTNLPLTDIKNYKKIFVRQGKRVQNEEPITQDQADADAGDVFGGAEPDFGGGEDLGAGAEDLGGGDTFEESIKQRKRKLVEQRYHAYTTDEMTLLITEAVGGLTTSNFLTSYCKPVKNDMDKFLGRKHSKKVLREDEIALKQSRKKERLQEETDDPDFTDEDLINDYKN